MSEEKQKSTAAEDLKGETAPSRPGEAEMADEELGKISGGGTLSRTSGLD